MLKNVDLKNMLIGYKPTPPERVWENIAFKLAQDNPERIGFWQFNSAQKFTLVAASFISIFLSAFVYNFNHPKNLITKNVKVESIKELPVESHLEKIGINSKVNYTKLETETKYPITSHKNKNLHIENSGSNTTNKTKISSKILFSEELKPFKKEVLELAELDRVIENLTRLVEKENINTVNHTEIYYANSEIQSKELIYNLQKYSSLQDKNTSESVISKLPISNSNFLSRIYFTPTFGVNYTQISYSNASNSPYFTQNAEFAGKIGYNAGFQLGYQFNKRWSIESGISFGQYIQAFKEQINNKSIEREGVMYIDQLDFPLLARYSIPIGNKKTPSTFSIKAGLMYNSVIQYQVNYLERDLLALNAPNILKNIDADKRNYNSLQLGYTAGFDFDSYLTDKISINLSILNSYVSQLENFPFFNRDAKKPRQFSTGFSIGTKIRL